MIQRSTPLAASATHHLTHPSARAPRAVIFDMDGVIVDSEPRHEQAFMEIFAEMGYADSHGIHFPDYYGRSDRALWLDFIARHQPPQPLDELIDWKQNRLIDILRKEQPIYPAIPGLVERLAAVYPMAVASGSMHRVIDAVLEMQGLRQHFRSVVSVQDVGRGKPAPDVFLKAAETLSVDPRDCWVIEDSAAGVEAAVTAGMTAIAITNSLPADRLRQAHYVVRDYATVEALLLPTRS